jgi:hypothetical protein
MSDNSNRLKNRRNITKLRKKAAAVAATTQASAALRKNGELFADQRVAATDAGPLSAQLSPGPVAGKSPPKPPGIPLQCAFPSAR